VVSDAEGGAPGRAPEAALAVGTDAYYPGSAGHEHPGPASVRLPSAIRDAIVAHARAEAPNEGCGIVVGDGPAAEGGVPRRWVPLRNAAHSAVRYSIDPDDLLRLTIETDDADEVFWAIVHSHVASPARPSPTDLRESHYAESLYILVSLASAETDSTSGQPGLRAWRIVDGGVHEVSVSIDG
jgi:proteasome lid subunit RPN8/RPN11